MNKINKEAMEFLSSEQAINNIRWLIEMAEVKPEEFIEKIENLSDNDVLIMRFHRVISCSYSDESLTRKSLSRILDIDNYTNFFTRHIEPYFIKRDDGSIQFSAHMPLLKRTKNVSKKRVGNPGKEKEEKKPGLPEIIYSPDTKFRKVSSNPSESLLNKIDTRITVANGLGLFDGGIFKIVRFIEGLLKSDESPTFIAFLKKEQEELYKIGERLKEYAPKSGEKLMNESKKMIEYLESFEEDNSSFEEVKKTNIDEVFTEFNNNQKSFIKDVITAQNEFKIIFQFVQMLLFLEQKKDKNPVYQLP